MILPTRKPRGPWRATRDEAVADAVAKGLAEADEHVAGRIYFHPLAVIEEGE